MSTIVATGTEFTCTGAPVAVRRPRLDVVDLLRGLVIALMVLDHTRDFFHAQAFTLNPTDPAHTTLILYLTRWAANLCAPTFVFLQVIWAIGLGMVAMAALRCCGPGPAT